MEFVDEEFFDGVIEAYNEIYNEANNEANNETYKKVTEKLNDKPKISFGQYQDYILVTLNDKSKLIKFLNKHGQVLTINKSKCEIKSINDIHYYYCFEAPYILYQNTDPWITKELMSLFENYF